MCKGGADNRMRPENVVPVIYAGRSHRAISVAGTHVHPLRPELSVRSIHCQLPILLEPQQASGLHMVAPTSSMGEHYCFPSAHSNAACQAPPSFR